MQQCYSSYCVATCMLRMHVARSATSSWILQYVWLVYDAVYDSISTASYKHCMSIQQSCHAGLLCRRTAVLRQSCIAVVTLEAVPSTDGTTSNVTAAIHDCLSMLVSMVVRDH